MPTFHHVSSSLNRASITMHGLDWRHMGAAPGIAGSPVPEVEGVFLVEDEFTVEFFLRINTTGGPVDVWRVDDVDPAELTDNGSGFDYVPRVIPAESLTLVRTNVPPRDH